MSSIKAGHITALPWIIGATGLAAGTSTEVIAPFDGYIDELGVIVEVAVGTGGVVTVLTGDAGAVTVAGISATIADSATKGTRVTSAATRGSSTRAVSKGDRIQIKPAAEFATSGALQGYLLIAEADTSPALPAA